MRRRLIEAAIFSVLLVIFLLFLRYLTRETSPAEGSGGMSGARLVDAPV